MKQSIFLVLLFLTLTTGYGYEEAIGIVNSIEGELIHINYGQSYHYQVSRKMTLYRNSIIDYAPGYKGAGELQIVIKNGEPKVFTNFPVNIGSEFSSAYSISEVEVEDLITYVGGTKVLSSEEDPTFEWFCNIKRVDEKIAENFKIIVSSKSSSAEEESINPLKYRLKRGVKLQKIDCTFTELNEYHEPIGQSLTIQWKKIRGEWRLDFSKLEHQPDRIYLLETTFIHKEGRKDKRRIIYQIMSKEELEKIRDEALEQLPNTPSDYQKTLALLDSYDDYDLILPAAQIRKEQGLIIRDLLMDIYHEQQ